MTRNPENPSGSGQDQAGDQIRKFLTDIPMSRRDSLKLGGRLAGVFFAAYIAEACSAVGTSASPSTRPTSGPDTSASASPSLKIDSTPLPTSIPNPTAQPSAVNASLAPSPIITPSPSASLETSSPSPTKTEILPTQTLVDSIVGTYGKSLGIRPETVRLSTKKLVDKKGNPFTVMSTPDSTPLLIYDKKDGWRESNISDLASKSGITLETMMQVTRQVNGTYVDLTQDSQYTGLIKENANQIYTSGESDMNWVFGGFTTADWNNVLSNWTNIQKQLVNGTIPDGLPYNWVGLDRLTDFAKLSGLGTRAFHLIWGDDIPPSILGYSNPDLKKILEFTVRARVLRHPEIKSWNIGDEIYARSLYQQGNTAGLWPDRFGAAKIVAFVGKLVKDTNPDAKLFVAEDFVLEKAFPDVNFTAGFISYLKQIQAQGVHINGVDIENNFWIYDPPDPKKIDSTLKTIKKLGIPIITSEETVAVSTTYPNWPSRPRVIRSVADTLKTQAQIYKDTLDAYIANNTGYFGTGGVWDALAWQNAIGHPEARPMLYDTKGAPKRADYALRQSLLANLTKVA